MKKILSIDGGGIRGIIAAMVLAEIEKKSGITIAESFDLIAGTSTGAILSLGLCKSNGNELPQFSARNLIDLYEERGSEIFSRSLWNNVSSLGGLTEELYSAEGLEKILEDYFSDTPIGESLTKILIPTYDIQNREPLFIKSWKKEHSEIQMKYVARAASAAPTYFEPALVHINNATKVLIDGGVFINSPAVSAFVEAKKIFPEEKEFLLISIGTGELTRPISFNEAKDWGRASWLLPLLSCMFDGVSDAVDYQLNILLNENYYRFQTNLSIASDDMDDSTLGNIENLKTEAKRLIRSNKKNIDSISKRLAIN